MTNKLIKALITSFNLLFVLTLSTGANAQQNPFGMSDLQTAKTHVASEKCAAGKCGANMDMSDDSGKEEATPPKEGKCGDGKNPAPKPKCGNGKSPSGES